MNTNTNIIDNDNDDAAPKKVESVVVDSEGYWYTFVPSAPRRGTSTPANTSGIDDATAVKLPSGRMVARQYLYGTGRDRYVYFVNTEGEFNWTDAEYIRSVLPKWESVSVPFSQSDWNECGYEQAFPDGQWKYADDDCSAYLGPIGVVVSTAYILGTWSDMVFGGHVRWHKPEVISVKSFIDGDFRPGPCRGAVKSLRAYLGLPAEE